MSRAIPCKGDVYEWSGVRMEVCRVDSQARWADVLCDTGPGTASWTKRQPLPLPIGSQKVER